MPENRVSPEADTEADPMLSRFLDFLDQEIRRNPESLRPLTARDIEGVDELLDRVEVDGDEPLGDPDFVLP
jgi:hypothetical protein